MVEAHGHSSMNLFIVNVSSMIREFSLYFYVACVICCISSVRCYFHLSNFCALFLLVMYYGEGEYLC